jgi:hypothetical protein
VWLICLDSTANKLHWTCLEASIASALLCVSTPLLEVQTAAKKSVKSWQKAVLQYPSLVLQVLEKE